MGPADTSPPLSPRSDASADVGLLDRAGSIIRRSRSLQNFHDTSLWSQEVERAPMPPDPVLSPRGTLTHAGMLQLLRKVAPTLSNPNGTALSASGVAAISAAGAAICHACRLVLRDLLERCAPRGISAASWRTFELYLLSLVHSGAWIGFALRSLLRSRLASASSASISGGGCHDAPADGVRVIGWLPQVACESSGGVRALGLSAGFHMYVLLSLRSIWTQPLVTLHHLGELFGITSQLRSQDLGRQGIALFGGLRGLPTFVLASLSALEHLGEPAGSRPFRVLRTAAVLTLLGCKAVFAPLAYRRLLPTLPALHQPEMLPRKIVTVLDAALSLGWLGTRLATRRSSRAERAHAPSLLVPELVRMVKQAAHQSRVQAATAIFSVTLQSEAL